MKLSLFSWIVLTFSDYGLENPPEFAEAEDKNTQRW
jgi:hypothetical protein